MTKIQQVFQEHFAAVAVLISTASNSWWCSGGLQRDLHLKSHQHCYKYKDLSFKHLFETRELQLPFEMEKIVLESRGIYRALLRKLIPKQTPSHLTPSFAPGIANSTLAHFPSPL